MSAALPETSLILCMGLSLRTCKTALSQLDNKHSNRFSNTNLICDFSDGTFRVMVKKFDLARRICSFMKSCLTVIRVGHKYSPV